MTMVSVHDAKAHFSALLHQVEQNREPVLISRYGKVVAQLVPAEAKKRSVVDPLLGQVEIHCDLTGEIVDEWNEA